MNKDSPTNQSNISYTSSQSNQSNLSYHSNDSDRHNESNSSKWADYKHLISNPNQIFPGSAGYSELGTKIIPQGGKHTFAWNIVRGDEYIVCIEGHCTGIQEENIWRMRKPVQYEK